MSTEVLNRGRLTADVTRSRTMPQRRLSHSLTLFRSPFLAAQLSRCLLDCLRASGPTFLTSLRSSHLRNVLWRLLLPLQGSADLGSDLRRHLGAEWSSSFPGTDDKAMHVDRVARLRSDRNVFRIDAQVPAIHMDLAGVLVQLTGAADTDFTFKKAHNSRRPLRERLAGIRGYSVPTFTEASVDNYVVHRSNPNLSEKLA